MTVETPDKSRAIGGRKEKRECMLNSRVFFIANVTLLAVNLVITPAKDSPSPPMTVPARDASVERHGTTHVESVDPFMPLEGFPPPEVDDKKPFNKMLFPKFQKPVYIIPHQEDAGVTPIGL